MAVNVKHVDLAKHQCSISQTLRQFWLDGELCDVVLKSSDGAAHPAHINVLCAASKVFHNLLRGFFAEADQVRKGEPVEIAASEPVVGALLEYIYGGQPELPVDSAMELLRLADAYNLPDLAAATETGLRSTLDEAPVATALNILKQSQGLHDLKAACEEKVALNFEDCLEEEAFLDLREGLLGRILRREDLKVSKEDMVFKAIFKWFKSAKGTRDGALALLLQNVDFQAISSRNLARIGRFALTLGPNGDELQSDIHEALRAQKNRCGAEAQDDYRPKRRCLQPASPYLGASSSACGQKVLPKLYGSLCCHGDALYYVADSGVGSTAIFRWKSGMEDPQLVVGAGAQVAGVNDLGTLFCATVSPDGRIVVADRDNNRLVSFRNGYGQVLADDIGGLKHAFCSPTGVVYVVNKEGKALQKLVGDTLQPVIDSEHLPEHNKFEAAAIFVTREEVVYISDNLHSRVLRVNPGDQRSVVVDVVGDAVDPSPLGLFVTEDGTIYVSDYMKSKVFALHPDDTTWTEVLMCPDQLVPVNVVLHDGSLYVSMFKESRDAPLKGCVYKYDLAPELHLE